MPLRHPDGLFVLLPSLEDGPALHIECLDRAAVSSCDQDSAITPYVSRMRNVVDAESRDGLDDFPGLRGEDLYARACGDGEEILSCSEEVRGRRRWYGDMRYR